MPCKLSQEEIVTLHVLKSKGHSNSHIARVLGVSEGTVRYRVKKKAESRPDGRATKVFRAEEVSGVIAEYVKDHDARESDRPICVRDLHEHLVADYGYGGSYRSVLRYVRAKFLVPKIRPRRRVETPPGAQAQVDWGEFRGVDIGDGPQTLYAFVMVLSHSRRPAVVWSLRMEQLSWHHAHNEAFRRLEGVPAIVRIDNLKTGVIRGAGPWGELNESYKSYARSLRFHIDPHLPRCPEHKGKVERRVGALRQLGVRGRRFESLAELQAWTDEAIDRYCERRLCPATGRTIQETWQSEVSLLTQPGAFPEPFDLVQTRHVHKDCTINVESRTYSVPFTHVYKQVEVRGCADRLQIVSGGRIVAEHPRGTKERILIDPAHYEGAGDDRVLPPLPLGRVGKKLMEIAEQPVELRSLEIYEALSGVVRS